MTLPTPIHVGGLIFRREREAAAWTARKQRAVFAMLALRVNRVVSMDVLVDGLLGDGAAHRSDQRGAGVPIPAA